jgi:phosphoglycolate phosphatase
VPRPLVLFDLDGTLVDTLPDIARALGDALAEIGVAPPALDVVKRMVGDGARQLVRRARAGRPDDPAEEDALLARFLASYRAHVCVASRLYPGAREALVALRAGGAALAVLTNKPGDLARALLTTLNAAAALDEIIGDGDGFPRKPDPTAARALLARFGSTPERTAIVGDGLPDMRLARALGATAVAATWGYVTAADLAAESPTHLADNLEAAVRFVRADLIR